MQITLKAARTNAKLTVKAAATALGITRELLWKYETGRSIPNIKVVEDMCKLYGTTIDDLCFK